MRSYRFSACTLKEVLRIGVVLGSCQFVRLAVHLQRRLGQG